MGLVEVWGVWTIVNTISIDSANLCVRFHSDSSIIRLKLHLVARPRGFHVCHMVFRSAVTGRVQVSLDFAVSCQTGMLLMSNPAQMPAKTHILRVLFVVCDQDVQGSTRPSLNGGRTAHNHNSKSRESRDAESISSWFPRHW